MSLIPTPEGLALEREPSAKLLALVEPATNMLIRATALDEVNQIRSQAEAIERYARTIRLTVEAIGAAQTIARRAEVRIGELDEKRGQGGRPSKAEKPLSADNGLDRVQRHEFRTMAAAAPTVEEVLDELAPQGKATRAAVLRAVKRSRLEDAGASMSRDVQPISELLDLQRSMKAALFGMHRMRDAGQEGFALAGLLRRIRELFTELEELMP